MEIVLYIVGAIALAVILLRVCLQRFLIHEYEAALLYRNGRFMRILRSGAYYRPRFWYDALVLDTRRTIETVPGQEILTVDNVGLKTSLVIDYEIVDPAKAFHTVQSYGGALYTIVQVVLRSVIGAVTADAILEKRIAIGQDLLEQAAPKAAELGLKLHSVEVKDVMFPGDLKNIFAEVAKAQKEGQAALERARGETAALRSLANAANMMKDNPTLMNLRVLQSIDQAARGEGNTFILGVPQGLASIADAPQAAAARAGTKKKRATRKPT